MSEHESGEGVAQDAPTGRRRRVALVVASVALAVQLLVPASYYVGEATADERFAWRMFSYQRAEQCNIVATETRLEGTRERGRRLKLSSVLHPAWIHGLKRRRPAIVERYFQWRCETSDATELDLILHCRSATGEKLPPDTLEHRCAGAP